MLRGLVKNWWVMLLQGILAIVFGIVTFVSPGLTVALLLGFFAAYCLIDGVTSLFATFKGGKSLWYVLGAVVSLGAGVIALMRPGLTAIALLIVIGVWAIVKGVAEIVAGFQLRKEIEGELWMMLSGLASLVFGLIVIFRPGAGALALLWMIGAFLILKGILLTLLSLKLKGLKGRVEGMVDSAAA